MTNNDDRMQYSGNRCQIRIYEKRIEVNIETSFEDLKSYNQGSTKLASSQCSEFEHFLFS